MAPSVCMATHFTKSLNAMLGKEESTVPFVSRRATLDGYTEPPPATQNSANTIFPSDCRANEEIMPVKAGDTENEESKVPSPFSKARDTRAVAPTCVNAPPTRIFPEGSTAHAFTCPLRAVEK